MNLLDIGIIFLLVLGIIEGIKNGFTKSLVNCVGLIIILILAFILKNPISEFLMLHMPFFDFYGFIKGVSVLNIAVYEIIAFALVFTVLSIILKILLFLTNIFEKILSFTIVLGIPSKILGAILGLIKNYIVAFVILFVLSLPLFQDNNIIKNSKLKDPILKTPVLYNFSKETTKVFNEFLEIKDNFSKDKTNEFNLETLDLFLKYEIVKPKLIQKLIDKDKLHIKDADKVLEKYKG